MGLPADSQALRAELNEIAASPLWRRMWTDRGYNVGSVRRCIRDMIELAVAREKIGDGKGFHAWCKHVLDYAAGRLIGEVKGADVEDDLTRVRELSAVWDPWLWGKADDGHADSPSTRRWHSSHSVSHSSG